MLEGPCTRAEALPSLLSTLLPPSSKEAAGQPNKILEETPMVFLPNLRSVPQLT